MRRGGADNNGDEDEECCGGLLLVERTTKKNDYSSPTPDTAIASDQILRLSSIKQSALNDHEPRLVPDAPTRARAHRRGRCCGGVTTPPQQRRPLRRLLLGCWCVTSASSAPLIVHVRTRAIRRPALSSCGLKLRVPKTLANSLTGPSQAKRSTRGARLRHRPGGVFICITRRCSDRVSASVRASEVDVKVTHRRANSSSHQGEGMNWHRRVWV